MNDKVVCRECSGLFSNMTTHLIKVHGMSKRDYLMKYPGEKVESDSFIKKQSMRMKKQYSRTDFNYRSIAGSRTFDFIENKDLRILLQRDYKSAKICLKSTLWKPAIILYGSIIEAILREKTQTKDFISAIEKAYKNRLISETEYHKIYLIKDFRNLVHIHKELQENIEINDSWAKTLYDICESIIRKFRG